MDGDGCIQTRMFVLLQLLAYLLMSANSLKQMETRGNVWPPKGMRDAESLNTFVFLQRCRLWKADTVS